MKPSLFIALVSFFPAGSFHCAAQELVCRAGSFSLSLDRAGRVASLRDARSGREYLPLGKRPPLLCLRVEGEFLAPRLAKWRSTEGKLLLDWGEGFKGEIRIDVKETHLRFELTALEGAERVDLVLWGPFPTTISEIIGETVGVVRDSRYAIGIQALNLKTLGGYPTYEDDHEPSYNIFRASSYVDVSEKVKILYRGQTAKPAPFGSVLQAYCRNRNETRIVPVWGHPRFVVPPLKDGGVLGTKIALFGCPSGAALETLGRIEISEGLPHPVLDGKWGKISHGATESYLILPFGERNLEEALEITKKAGLRYLYQGGPFRTWGHFELDPRLFPHGREGLRKCVERAAAQGIRLGVHTLSNFITTNDSYVRPVPDPRLAKIGSTKLARPAGAGDRVLYIEDPGFFHPPGTNALHAVRLEKELVRYGRISAERPWRLLDCRRGAFGTRPSSHAEGTEVARLLDHDYKVFLTDADLSLEVAGRIADLFNETGLRQISFDGLEGNWSTGLGQYGRQRFVKMWWDRLRPGLRGRVVTDASNPGHFFWHIFTRMNWGEPWYAGFRESQTRYRLMNQDYFHRNFIPPMLGWFRMSASTSLEDIEWLLARAAGFEAGFALVTSFRALSTNGKSGEILQAVRNWEKGRREGLFPRDLKPALRDISREFHLEVPEKGAWRLYPVQASLGNLHPRKDGPWESVHEFVNPYEAGPVDVTLRIHQVKGALLARSITLQVGEGKRVALPTGLEGNRILRLGREGWAVLYDRSWKVIRSFRAGPLLLEKGKNRIRLSCTFEGEGKGGLKAEFRVTGPPVEIPAGKG